MDKTPITKKTLEHLAELARIRIKEEGEKGKEEKLLNDLQKILRHFEELKEVDTENVEPTRPLEFARAKSGAMAGGTIETNVFREDGVIDKELCEKQKKLIDAFPEKEDGFLKVPPVFE